MPRYLTRGLQVGLDLLVLSGAFWIGFLFRFELRLPSYWTWVALMSWPYVVLLEYVVLSLFSVPSYSWRYVSLREAARIAAALAASTIVLIVLRVSLPASPLKFAVIPLGVIGSNVFLAFVGLVGIRAIRRVYGESRERRLRDEGRAKKRVLLLGAGQAGVLVARELMARPDLGLHPVGFLDDDPLKVGSRIGGLTVLGTTERVVEIAERKRVDRALITIANATGADIRRITIGCQEAGLETKIIPGIYEIVGGRVNLSRIREVAIEDLLGREPVQLDDEELSAAIANRVVMVTGAGGSIGSELCRQACRYAPKRLLLVERFENALFEIHRELTAEFPGIEVKPCVADVTDAKRLEQIFAEGRPTIVIHAAAHKHVPMMELNPGEAVKNNVGGTRVVADLAHAYEAERFVLVSTDKAVNPSSVMGATKRVAEIYTQALGRTSKTRFVTVRFGNVLGSNGSVIPIFKEQIAKGGPIKVTHPDMQRYFMTVPEAAQLVLQAGAMGQGGEILILDMGNPVKIVDLARDLITLSGLKPDEDIGIEFVGTRPGEKLFEQLSTDSEHADKTKHPKIFIGRVAAATTDAPRAVEELVAVGNRPDAVRDMLLKIVPEYTGAGEPTPAKPQRRDSATGPEPLIAAS